MRVNIFRQDGDRRNTLAVFDFLAISNLLGDLHALLADLIPLLRNGGVQRSVLDAEQNLGAVVDANAVEIIFDAVIADEGSGTDTDIAVKGNNGVQFGIRNIERGELVSRRGSDGIILKSIDDNRIRADFSQTINEGLNLNVLHLDGEERLTGRNVNRLIAHQFHQRIGRIRAQLDSVRTDQSRHIFLRTGGCANQRHSGILGTLKHFLKQAGVRDHTDSQNIGAVVQRRFSQLNLRYNVRREGAR